MGGKLQYVPWVLAFATAVWFGWMARKAGRSLVQWVLTGAVFGLATATIVLGLCQAASIPFSDHERTIMHFKWTGAAIIVIAVLGWVITLGLHRHHLWLWSVATKMPPPGAKESLPPRPESKIEPSKPFSGRT